MIFELSAAAAQKYIEARSPAADKIIKPIYKQNPSPAEAVHWRGRLLEDEEFNDLKRHVLLCAHQGLHAAAHDHMLV